MKPHKRAPLRLFWHEPTRSNVLLKNTKVVNNMAIALKHKTKRTRQVRSRGVRGVRDSRVRKHRNRLSELPLPFRWRMYDLANYKYVGPPAPTSNKSHCEPTLPHEVKSVVKVVVKAQVMNTQMRKKPGRSCYCEASDHCRHALTRIKPLRKAETTHMRRVVIRHAQIQRWGQAQVAGWLQERKEQLREPGDMGQVMARVINTRIRKKPSMSCYCTASGACRHTATFIMSRKEAEAAKARRIVQQRIQSHSWAEAWVAKYMQERQYQMQGSLDMPPTLAMSDTTGPPPQLAGEQEQAADLTSLLHGLDIERTEIDGNVKNENFQGKLAAPNTTDAVAVVISQHRGEDRGIFLAGVQDQSQDKVAKERKHPSAVSSLTTTPMTAVVSSADQLSSGYDSYMVGKPDVHISHNIDKAVHGLGGQSTVKAVNYQSHDETCNTISSSQAAQGQGNNEADREEGTGPYHLPQVLNVMRNPSDDGEVSRTHCKQIEASQNIGDGIDAQGSQNMDQEVKVAGCQGNNQIKNSLPSSQAAPDQAPRAEEQNAKVSHNTLPVSSSTTKPSSSAMIRAENFLLRFVADREEEAGFNALLQGLNVVKTEDNHSEVGISK